MKILVSAYACHPDASSERGVGWTWARAAAQRNDVWLLTRVKNRDAIENAIATQGLSTLHPVYIDLPDWARFWKRGERGMYAYYSIWQALAWKKARQLHAQIRFDVAHHVTFALDWLPAGACLVPGLPAVWGPVGGAQRPPVHLWPSLGAAGLAKVALRWLVTGLGRRMFGAPTARRSALVAVLNDDVAEVFSRFQPVVEQNAVVPTSFVGERDVAEMTALFVGRLLPLKGIHLALEAFARPELRKWRFDVIGDGPHRATLEEQARRLRISDRVRFRGVQPRDEVLASLLKAQAFVFPSFHDSAGWAVAEAISVGCPVVCLDIGGPGTMVTPTDGVCVAPSAGVVERLARAVRDVGQGTAPSSRWCEQRLPHLLDGWYGTAIAGSGEGGPRSSQSVGGPK